MIEFEGKKFLNEQEAYLYCLEQIKIIKQSLGNALPDPIQGPQGDTGADGPRGPQGPRGTGVFGCTAVLPSATAYQEGDFYILFDGSLFKKINGNWIRQTILKGPQGPIGLPGGTEVIANPAEAATDELNKINVDGTTYSLPFVPKSRKVAGYILENDITSQNLDTEIKLSKDLLKVNNPNVVSGYYPNSSSVISSSLIHKCLKHTPKSKDLTIKYEVLAVTSITKINVEYLDGTIRPLTYGILGNFEFSFTNVKAIYINFFSDENNFEVEIDYEERLSSQVLSATNLPSFSIGKTYNITKKNCTDAGRYYLNGGVIDFIASFPSTTHQCAKIALNGRKFLLSYNMGSTPTSLIQAIIEYNDGTIDASLLGNTNISNYKIENAKFLYLNFYGGSAGQYVETYTLNDNNNELNAYEDYADNTYEWTSKKCVCAGDSISTDLDGGTSWSSKFANFVGCTMTNLAISGAHYYGGDVKTLLEQITDYSGNKSEIDYVFLAGGTNDYWFSTELTDFKQAVSDTIDYALENYPNAKIIIITPIEFNGSSSNTEQLQTYRNIITEVAISKDSSGRISVVQGNKFNFGKTAGNSYTTLMQYDGVHPTQLGLKTVYLKGLLKILKK